LRMSRRAVLSIAADSLAFSGPPLMSTPWVHFPVKSGYDWLCSLVSLESAEESRLDGGNMDQSDLPVPEHGFFVAHFLTVKDQAKSREFYVDVLGGKVVRPQDPCYIKLANSWIILNSGGGPTPDKPEVILETPRDLNTVNSFLNLRVADIQACYKEWKQKGAHFLTEPLNNHGEEMRCYMRDPDGYLIEVGQNSPQAIEAFKEYLEHAGAANKKH
ncbi:MAG TPA: VOC family protein, partial [Blastocatellia bacterium]